MEATEQQARYRVILLVLDRGMTLEDALRKLACGRDDVLPAEVDPQQAAEWVEDERQAREHLLSLYEGDPGELARRWTVRSLRRYDALVDEADERKAAGTWTDVDEKRMVKLTREVKAMLAAKPQAQRPEERDQLDPDELAALLEAHESRTDDEPQAQAEPEEGEAADPLTALVDAHEATRSAPAAA